ncbi:MAG TPA: zinc-binding alcohol dehydrogenase [Prolixibacteraceae bacterium]|jgi:NADPH:quinone reductase-like Zn-dependent oxidoreductase|nr:zinc-binding alcohol dehydrogenase [Prolixibacteraceae bacterium]
MKAMLIYKYGSPDVFEWEEIHVPPIKDDELLVKAYGSSVNPVDCAIRRGDLYPYIRLDLPAVLGVDVSGIVEKVGKKVTRFRVGDRVYAFLGLQFNGAYAEFVAIPEAHAALIPSNLNIAQAGVVPCVGLTAYEAFTEYAPVKKGMQVLINGAGGGVGIFAIQIAKAMEAQVTAICSEAKAEVAKRMGADVVINYHKQNILKSDLRFDVILNCVRGSKIGQWKKLLKKDGRQIVIAANPQQMPFIKLSNLFSSTKSILLNVKADGNALNGLSALISERKVKPIISKTFELEALIRAHRLYEAESVAGKIAIAMNGNS